MREIEQLHRDLDQSSIDLRRLDEEIDDLRGKASELPVLKRSSKASPRSADPMQRGSTQRIWRKARARKSVCPALSSPC